MNKKYNYITLLLIPAILLSCTGSQAPQKESVYAAMTARPTSVELKNKYSANIRGKSDISVYPQVSGYITRVFPEEGAIVKKGQSLFIIDQVPYQTAYETAAANVAVAQAQVETARITYQSKQELHKENVISDFELQTSRNALASAEAQLKLQESQMASAANNLSYTIVKSPCDGIIGTLPYKEGASVGPTIPVPLTTVSDNTEMFVYFSMTENQLLALTRNYPSLSAAIEAMPAVELELSDGSLYEYPGTLRSISGVIDQTTGAVSLKAAFPNPGRILHSGGSGNVIIPQKHNQVFVIPKAATFEIQDKIYVYAIEHGQAKSRRIEVTPSSTKTEYVVTAGIETGDVILTQGVGFIKEGMPVLTKMED